MADLARDSRKVPVQVLQPGDTTKITIGAASVASGILTSNIVRVISTIACHIVVGSGPVATTSDMLIPANVPEYFEVGDIVGDSTLSQIAVIDAAAAGGILYITEMI